MTAFKSGDSLEGADVMDTEMQYLYNDGEFFHFMVPESFEQHATTPEVVGDKAKLDQVKETCIITLWNGQPIAVMPPNSVILTITDTDPGVRGDTSGGGGKPATLNGGGGSRAFVRR